jgi:hypothetical protein
MANETGTAAPITRDVPSPRYADATLRLEIHVVDSLLVVNHDVCQHCGEHAIACNAWTPLEGGDMPIVETCTACLIPVLDATPYLDDTQTITVEVARAATVRPF